MMKRVDYFKYLMSILLILAVILAIQKNGGAPLEASSRNTQMDQWIMELKKDPLFQKMNVDTVKNNIEQYSLTPTYTMLTFPVSIQYKAYLIVSTDSSNQEHILEYGIGSFLPYQKDAIINEDIKQLTPKNFRYISPIESYWTYDLNKEKVYIEGSTGEWLPNFNEAVLNTYTNTSITYDDHLSNSIIDKNLSFNPMENLSWLSRDSKSNSLDWDQVQSLLKEKQKLMVVGNKYNEQVKFAYPIIGYQLWGTNQFYLAIYDDDMDLVRFLSANNLGEYGQVLQ
ncbi:hypothetical protein [Tepidibacillus marianensis]|uniref:hypothetical protein n=1 Tax=Tepidibacillus marianensis TaxID=3131995 RepID=UPI0030D45C18